MGGVCGWAGSVFTAPELVEEDKLPRSGWGWGWGRMAPWTHAELLTFTSGKSCFRQRTIIRGSNSWYRPCDNGARSARGWGQVGALFRHPPEGRHT